MLGTGRVDGPLKDNLVKGRQEPIVVVAAVQGRWRFSYVEVQEPAAAESGEDFTFIVALTLTDRKKLVNLKKGDWTTLTAGPFTALPVYLSNIEYNDGTAKVSLIFTKTQPPPATKFV
jgi:hypothetical protein